MELFEKHEETLKQALAAIDSRRYWSPYPDSPRAYGDDAPQKGQEAFERLLNRPFGLGQPATGRSSAAENSPYGAELGLTYPVASVAILIKAASKAMKTWGSASPHQRVGVCLEILDRLKDDSFEMAHAVMRTTGQPFLMAFQTGGPQALDRGLEAVAYAFEEMTRLPAGQMTWEKPQGRRDPLRVEKQWRIRPRGVAVTLGVSTFPTLNGYPGIFASLATGNPVIIKPHPATVLPLALFAKTARAVLADAGYDPNTVLLAIDTPDSPMGRELVSDPAVGVIDYIGTSGFGDWLEKNIDHALVFTGKAGVNSVVIDSVEDLKGMLRNLSVSLSMYSGQMATTPQNVFIPRNGIQVGDERVPFDEIVAGLVTEVRGYLSDDQRAGDILGAIKDPGISRRILDAANSGEVLLESRLVDHPTFPEAEVRTPVIVKVDAAERDVYMREMFGPIVFIIATDSTEESLTLARESATAYGALTWLVYTTNEETVAAAIDAAVDGGVSVTFNPTGGFYVNHSSAFSDFVSTGANPAGNAAPSDAAYVAGRYRVVGVRLSQ